MAENGGLSPIQQRTVIAMAWDGLMAALAILSVAMVFWHEKGGIGPFTSRDLEWIDLGVVGVFAADWVFFYLRSDDRKRYFRRTWWDILGMYPLIAGGAGFLRLFRLLRILRVLRAVRSIGRFLDGTRRLATKSNLPQIGIAAVTITVTGALLIWLLERDASGTQLSSFPEALWWAVVTVTTVGYGDITPVTGLGRIVAVFLMVTGIGTIAMLASGVTGALLSPSDEEGQDIGEGPEATSENVAGQLAGLADLHAKGHLTDQEFAAAKDKVLTVSTTGDSA